MAEIKSLESLGPHELQSIRRVKPVNPEDSPSVSSEHQFCKRCKATKLSIYHGFDVCMRCIIKAAKDFDPNIKSYSAIPGEMRYRIWRKLRIRARQPVTG